MSFSAWDSQQARSRAGHADPEAGRPNPATPHTDEDALEAFRRLDLFLASNVLTPTLAALEAKLEGINRAAAADLGQATGFDEDLVDAALVVRERVGTLDTMIPELRTW